MSAQHPTLYKPNLGEQQPLYRLQAYLVEAKKCVILLRELLEEFKGLVVILVLLAIFLLEAFHLLFKWVI